MGAETVGIAVISALVYSVIFYCKKAMKPDKPPEFDYMKLASTLIVGLIIGIAFCLSGLAITAEAIEVQLIAYAGVVALVESILKIIYRAVFERK